MHRTILDQESIVYGCIKGPSSLPVSEQRVQMAVNTRAIAQLPPVDEWPFLTRDMFTIPPCRVNGHLTQTAIIHFGLSYKGVEYEWSEWINKFETLLQAMHWQSAVVHLETELMGTHTFVWDTAEEAHQPGQGPLRVRCEWNHEVGLSGCPV